MTGLPEGAPVNAAMLRTLGVTPQLARRYVEYGWLRRLARGLYERVGDALQLDPCLRELEVNMPGLHVGGKSALDWYGIRQYVARRPILRLYGPRPFRLPPWFTARFPARYHAKNLFDESPRSLLVTSRFRSDATGPMVSEPERGFLEMLSEVGVRQPISEARELAGHTHTLRAAELRTLLLACRSVKTVRLTLLLGAEVEAPWLAGLKGVALPKGSNSRWVMRSSDGLLVLKP
jgi:hypothetical protein